MNITKFDIELDKDDCTYEPGEEINGRVLMCLENPKSARGLKVKAEGRCDVEWVNKKTVEGPNGPRRASPVIITGSEHYINRTEYLIGRENGPKTKFPAGEQSYPFRFRLPRRIPSSFRDDYGKVTYFLKAIIDCPCRADHVVTKGFIVISKLNLNTVHGADKKLHDECTLSFRNGLRCSLGEVDVGINLPVRGYVPGQTINAKVYFNNKSELDVIKVKLDFIQTITYKVPKDNEKMAVNKILESKTRRTIGKFGEFDMDILVESLPVSFFPFCKLIDINYELNVTYIIHESKISNNYQIAIGTIPLTSTQSEWSTASVPVESTEPIAPYPPESEAPVAPYPPGPEAPYPPGPDAPVAPYPPGPEAPYPPGPNAPVAPYPPGPEAPYPPGPNAPVAPYPAGPEAPYPPGPNAPVAPYPPGPEAPYPPGPEAPVAPYPPEPADRAMSINCQPKPQNYKFGFESYKPRAGEPVTGIPFVPVPGPSTIPIGFVLPPEFPPPSYEECTRESHPVDQKEEPNSNADVRQPLIPPYPVDNLPYKSN